MEECISDTVTSLWVLKLAFPLNFSSCLIFPTNLPHMMSVWCSYDNLLSMWSPSNTQVSLITEDLNDADITEDILQEKVLTLDNNCVSNSEKQMTKGILEKEKNVITFQSTEDLKDADKAEDILEEKVLTLHNDCVSNSEKQTTKDDIEKEKNVITFQSLDVLSREELNQKADASYSLDVSTVLYACHHCSKTFRDKHHMNGHVDIHFDFSFPCTICDTILGSRNGLRCHKKKKTQTLRIKVFRKILL